MTSGRPSGRPQPVTSSRNVAAKYSSVVLVFVCGSAVTSRPWLSRKARSSTATWNASEGEALRRELEDPRSVREQPYLRHEPATQRRRPEHQLEHERRAEDAQAVQPEPRRGVGGEERALLLREELPDGAAAANCLEYLLVRRSSPSSTPSRRSSPASRRPRRSCLPTAGCPPAGRPGRPGEA